MKDSEKLEASVKLGSSTRSEKIEVLDFGHAPLEVIEKFQTFCKDHSSLGEAIISLLNRECLLTRKYKFIGCAVTYQLLAEPTTNDSKSKLDIALKALQRFTRRGKYDSIANAIEELLISPDVRSSHFVDKATWTDGNVGTNYTELSNNEQLVLEQIADALLNKLSSVVPLPKKRRTNVQKEHGKETKKMKINIENDSSRYQIDELNFQPILNGAFLSKKEVATHKLPGTHLCLYQSECNNNQVKREIVDAEVAIPIKNFLASGTTTMKTLPPDITVFTSQRKRPTKVQFLRGFFNLLPVIIPKPK